jgi:1-phosphatidylinositol phosphodiesterase
MKGSSNFENADHDVNEEYNLVELMNYYDNNNSIIETDDVNQSSLDNSEELHPEADLGIDDTGLQNISPASWMSLIKSNVSITDITIPGTHDSCATRVYPYAQCQALSLPDQLNLGVRFLDIRCRHFNNGFPIHHGPVYLNINFREVLKYVTSFLRKQHSEFVIMSVKEEYNPSGNSRSFEATLMSYLNEVKDFLYLGRDFPKIDSIRGKIVLLSRYASNSIGLNATPWKDNSTFDIRASKMRIQDEYKVDIFHKSKFAKVEPTLLDANNERSNRREKGFWLYLNFCSGFNAGSPVAARTIAENTNADLNRYLAGTDKKRYGIIVLDFPYPAVVNNIIKQNNWII